MMDISEDEREETEDKRRKPRIMRENKAYFARATINKNTCDKGLNEDN